MIIHSSNKLRLSTLTSLCVRPCIWAFHSKSFLTSVLHNTHDSLPIALYVVTVKENLFSRFGRLQKKKVKSIIFVTNSLNIASNNLVTHIKNYCNINLQIRIMLKLHLMQTVDL
jgi:hypothetical protein